MSSRDMIIYGAGGLGREIAAMAESRCHAGNHTPFWRVTGFVDDTPGMRGQIIHGIPCLGSFSEVLEMRSKLTSWCHIAIGDNNQRRLAALRMIDAGWSMATVIHSSTLLSRETTLGGGTLIGANCTISPNVSIGKNVLINSRSTIGHHAFIDDYAQISSGASVLGYGRVERGAMIGAHAVVISNVTIGAWATVAAGTPALRSVKPGHTICLPLAKTLFIRQHLPDEGNNFEE